jgi:hypothetical protein
MSASKLLGTLAVLSIACSASAQPAAQKPKPPKKTTAPAKPADKTPAPAPATAPVAAPAKDVKIHTKYVNGAQVSENTTYLKGVRQRFEFPGVTMIAQCDLNRSIQLHEASMHFLIVSTDQPAAARAAAAPPPAAAPGPAAPAKPQGGVIAETVTLTDTGERKQMFGLEARHIKMATVRRPGANACDPKTTSIDVDGWYADLPEQASCKAPSAAPQPPAGQTCTDRVETQTVGTAKLGFPLSTAVTTTSEDSKEKDVTTMAMDVTELNVLALDAALFDIPPGYTEVKNYQELLPSLNAGGSLADAVFGSLSDGTSGVAPKQPGVIRVGIVDPVDKSGRETPLPVLRGGVLASLSKAPLEALPLTGATSADLDRDAAAKSCDFLLTTEIMEIKTSKPSKIGGALKRVSGDPNASGDVHDARVDYKLFAVGEQTKPKATGTAKASSGGGFGVGSALRVAAYAGSMYMTMGMNSGMLGMMGPSSLGMAGMGGGMAGLMNPGMGAAMSIVSAGAGAGMSMPGGTSGLADPSTQKVVQTVQDALSKAGKQVAEELKTGKVKAAGSNR